MLNHSPPMPQKYDLFGIDVSSVQYDQELECIIHAAKLRQPFLVSHLAVHGLMEGCRDAELGTMLNQFDILAPDGQPVRHALNVLYKTGMRENCRGSELMLRLCRRAADEGIAICLYGSTQSVVEALRLNLIVRFPGLNIVWAEPSLFRPLTEQEDAALVERVNESGAGILFLGLGCPLQERFAFAHRDRFQAVQICVGAAFDFLSGNKKMAPVWMSRHCLEWAFRLGQEPRRLFARYLVKNTGFLWRFVLYSLSYRKKRSKT